MDPGLQTNRPMILTTTTSPGAVLLALAEAAWILTDAADNDRVAARRIAVAF